jgi:hypothetical protein
MSIGKSEVTATMVNLAGGTDHMPYSEGAFCYSTDSVSGMRTEYDENYASNAEHVSENVKDILSNIFSGVEELSYTPIELVPDVTLSVCETCSGNAGADCIACDGEGEVYDPEKNLIDLGGCTVSLAQLNRFAPCSDLAYAYVAGSNMLMLRYFDNYGFIMAYSIDES